MNKIRHRWLVVLVTAILVLFLAAVSAEAKETAAGVSQYRLVNRFNTAVNSAKFWTQAQTKKIKKSVNTLIARTGITKVLRSTGIVKTTVPGYFKALSSQNLLYDYNRDGVVNGKDYSLLVSSTKKAKLPEPLSPLKETLASENPATADNIVLPSLRAFGSDLFTGSATISYPIDLPPYKANLAATLAVSYSSGAVDDLYSGTKTKWRNDANHPYQKQAGSFGLGWDMSGGGSIVRDTSGTLEDESDDKFILSFAGGSANLTKESDDGSYSVWRTVPNQKLKVERWSLCKEYEYEGDNSLFVCRYRWTVTDGDGTKYYFGYPGTVDNWERPQDPENEYFDQGSGNDWFPLYDETVDGPQGYTSWMIYGSSTKGYHALTYNWHLFQVESLYDQSGPPTQPPDGSGSEVEINYRYLFEFGEHKDKSYVTAEYPYKISYGPHEVLFKKEPRLDWQTHVGDESGGEQTFRRQSRINQIVIKSLNKIRKVYKFEYHYGWNPAKHNDINQNGIPEDGEVVAGQVIHLLLNKITAYGGDPEANPDKRLPSFNFSYGGDCGDFKGGCPLTAFVNANNNDQAQTPNDFFLKKADNGLKGKVSFEYWESGGGNALAVKYCDSDKLTRDGDICRNDHAYNLQRHRLKATISNDGMNNTVRTEFNYTGDGAVEGLAFVTGYGDEWYQGQNCCSVRDGECRAGVPSGCRCPGDSETNVVAHQWDCVGGTACNWDDISGSGCPQDLPLDWYARCENPANGNRYICPGTINNPNTTCYSNCKYQADPFAGYEFLGYPEVETIVYEKNSAIDIAAKSKAFYHQAMETASCFKPSPLKGAVKQSLVYDADDLNRYQQQNQSFRVRFGAMFGSYEEREETELDNYCGSYEPEEMVSLVLATESVNKSVMPSPQLCTKNTVDYNNLDGSVDHYGLPHKQINWGKVDCVNPANDDTSDSAKYAFTEYTNPNEIKGIQPQPKENWVSDSGVGEKYNHAQIFYDGLGFGILGDLARVNKTTRMLDDSPYSDTTFIYKTSYPWQLASQTDHLGRTNTFNYDNIYRAFIVQATNPLGQSVFTEYDFNSNDSSHPNYQDVFGNPVKIKDTNNETTTFVYDDFGRLLETYLPGKAPGAGVKANLIASYYYFNDEDGLSACVWQTNCKADLGKTDKRPLWSQNALRQRYALR